MSLEVYINSIHLGILCNCVSTLCTLRGLHYRNKLEYHILGSCTDPTQAWCHSAFSILIILSLIKQAGLVLLGVSQFSPSVRSDTLWPHGPQHARPPCPSPTPRVCSLMSTESMIPSNNLILCHPLLLLPSSFSSIRVFSNKSTLHIRWPKYWSFSFRITPSNEYSGQISFRMDWLDLLAVQRILKSLLQHHSSKASILRCTAFFIVELSHPYWENHSLD